MISMNSSLECSQNGHSVFMNLRVLITIRATVGGWDGGERGEWAPLLGTVGWGSSCSWRWIDSKAAAKRPTLLCVFFRPLPLVPAPAASLLAQIQPAIPRLLQPLYHTAFFPTPSVSLPQFPRAGTVYCEPEDPGNRKFPQRAPL